MARGINGLLRRARLLQAAALIACVASCSERRSTAQEPEETLPPADVKVNALRVDGPPRTGGNPIGHAFIERFDHPFDDNVADIADYVMDDDWIATGFDPKNVKFEHDSMTLKLEKRRIGVQAWAGAEYQRDGFFGYGRYEVVMQPPAGSGIVSSFFTHTGKWFGDPHEEIDFEFLGQNTHEIHIKHFHKGGSPGSVYVQLPFDYSEAPHLYAFEWMPDSIRWYVDGQLVHEASGPDAMIPDRSSRILMNIWTGRGDSIAWHGPQEFGNVARARYFCVSHVPVGETGPQCSDG